MRFEVAKNEVGCVGFHRSLDELTRALRIITTDAYAPCHTVRRFLSGILRVWRCTERTWKKKTESERGEYRQQTSNARAGTQRFSHYLHHKISRGGTTTAGEKQGPPCTRFTDTDLNFKSSAGVLRTSLIFSGIITSALGVSLSLEKIIYSTFPFFFFLSPVRRSYPIQLSVRT